MPETFTKKHNIPQELHDGVYHHEFETSPDADIETALIRTTNRELGGVALKGLDESISLADNGMEGREADSRRPGAIIDLHFAGNKSVSIRPLSEYDIPSAKERLPFPKELRDYIEGREEVRGAKNKRTAEFDRQRRIEDRDGYDKQTLQTIKRFLHDNPRGARVLEQMGMESAKDMESLSIKDSIRLTGYVIASATSYSRESTKGRRNEADDLASRDILQRGLSVESQDEIEPLGVCRNYADMTQSVFKSLKRINPNLRNTHCLSRGGIGSATDGQLLSKSELQYPRPHAWNDFVTALPGNEIAITTVDPTYVRIKDNGKLVNYDQTALRAGTHLRNITKAFDGLDRAKRIRNAESAQNFYKKQIDVTVDAVRNKYGKASDVPANMHRSLQSLALEYAGAVRQFGGDTVDMSGMPKGIRHLVESAVSNDDIVLSPFEFTTAMAVVLSHNTQDVDRKNDLLDALEQKRRFADKHNLVNYFKANELDGEYPG